MPSVTFRIRKDYIKKDGKTPILLIVNLKGSKAKINTGVSVEPEKWDEKNQKIKGGAKAKDQNLIISTYKAKATDILVKYRLRHKIPSVLQFKKDFTEYENNDTFFPWALAMVKRRVQLGEIADSSGKQHTSSLSDLKNMFPTLKFSEINIELIEQIVLNLQKKKLKQNTINKKLRTFKAYINIAIGKELMAKNPFDNYKLKKAVGEIKYLTKEQVTLLIKAYSQHKFTPGVHRAARIFLFSFFLCGVRLSDVMRFTPEWIVGNTVVFQPLKTERITQKTLKLPLPVQIKQLIKDENPHKIKGRLFKNISEQKINKHLKTVGKYLDCSFPLSFHVARHTFATIFIEETSDLATLSELLGHNEIKTTMIYVHLTEEKKRKSLDKVTSLFSY